MRRFWQYLCVFLLVMFGSAGYTILTFKPNSSLIIDPGIDTDATPIFDNTFAKIMETRNANAVFELFVENENLNVNANGDITIKLTDDGFDFNFVLNALINENEYKINILLKDQTVYINFANLNVKFKIPNSLSDISQIMDTIKPILNELGLGELDLGSLDLNSIMSMFNIQENALSDGSGYQVNLDVAGMISVLIQTDNNYAPKLFKIENFNLNGTEVNFNASTDFVTEVEEISLSEKQEEALDISASATLVNLLLGRIDDKQFNVNFNVNYAEQEVLGSLKLDIEQMKGQAEISALNKQINIWFDKENIYASTMGLNIKSSFDNIKTFIEQVQSLSGINLDVIEETGLLVKGNEDEVLGSNLFDNFDINLIDLSFIKSIENTDSGVLIKFDDFEILFESDQNSTLGNIVFNGFGVNANLSFNDEEFVIEEPQNHFCDIIQIENYIQKINELIKANAIELDAKFKVDSNVISAQVLVDLKSYAIQINTNIFGEDLTLILNKNQAFIQWFNNSFVTDYSNLSASIKNLFAKFGINENIDISKILPEDLLNKIDEIKEKLENINLEEININDILKLVSNFNGFDKFCICDNTINLEIFGLDLSVECNDAINLTAKYKNFEFNGLINESDKQVIIPQNAVVIEDLVDTFTQKIDEFNRSKFSFKVDFNFNNSLYVANILLDIENKKAQISTDILNSDLEIYFANNTVYISYEDIKASFCLNDFDIVLDKVNNFVDIKSKLNDLTNKYPEVKQLINILNEIKEQGVLEFVKNIIENNKDSFDIWSILDLNVKDYIENFTINTEVISLKLKNGVNFVFDLKQNKLALAGNVNEQKFSIDVAVIDEDFEIEFNEKQFNNIINLLPIVDFANDILSKKQLSGSLEFSALSQTLNIDFNVSFENELKLQANTTILGLDLEIILCNNLLYVTLDQTKIVVDLKDQTWLEKVNELIEKLNLEQLINNQETSGESSADSQTSELEQTINTVIEWAKNVYTNLTDFENIFDNIQMLTWTESELVAIVCNIELRVYFESNTVSLVTVSANIPEIENVKLKLGSLTTSAKFNEINAEEYCSLDELITSIDEIVEQIYSKKFAFNVGFVLDNFDITANVKLDLTNGFNINVQTNIYDININLTIIGDDIYISLNNKVKLTANINDIENLLSEIEKFGVNLESIKPIIAQVIDIKSQFENAVLNGNFIGFAMQFVEMPAIDSNLIAGVMNTKITKLQITPELINVVFDDFSISVTLLNGIENVAISTSKFNASIQMLSNDFEIEINKNKYSNISNLKPVLDFANDILSKKQLSGSLELLALSQTLNIDFNVSFENELKLQANTTILGLDLEIILCNNLLYVTLDQTKIVVDLKDQTWLEKVNELIEKLNLEQLINNQETSGESSADSQTSELEQTINTVIEWAKNVYTNLTDFENIFDNIQMLTWTESELVAIVCNIELRVYFESNTVGLVTVSANIPEIENIKLKLSNISTSASFNTVNENEYTLISDLISVVNGVYEQIKALQFGMNVDFTLGNTNIKAKLNIDLSDDIEFNVDFVFNNMQFNVALKDSIIYISVDNKINVSAELEKSAELVDVVAEFVEFDAEYIKEILNTVIAFVSDWQTEIKNLLSNDLDMSATELNIEKIALNKNSLNIIINGISADIIFENDKILNVSVKLTNGNEEGNAINVSVDIVKFESINALTGCIDVSQLSPLANYVAEIYKSKIFGGSASLVVSNQTINFDYVLDLSGNEIKASIHTTDKIIGQHLNIILIGTDVYFMADNLNLHFDINDIDSIISEVYRILDLQSSDFNTDELFNLDLSLDLISSLEVANNMLILSLSNGLRCEINLETEHLGNVYLSYDILEINLNAEAQQNADIKVPEKAFVEHTVLLDMFENVWNKYQTKNFGLDLTLSSGNDTYTAQVAVDLSSGQLKASVVASLTVPQLVKDENGNDIKATYNIELLLENQMIYVKVNDKYISMKLSSIGNLIETLKSFINVDLSAILDLVNIDTGELNEEQIKDMLPENGAKDVLFLDIIKNISLTQDGILDITVSGGQKVVLVSSKDELKSLTISNVNLQGMNVLIVSDFTKTYPVVAKQDVNYLDISQLADCATVVKNTIDNSTEYRIKGTFSIKFDIGIEISLNSFSNIELEVIIKRFENGEFAIGAVISKLPDPTTANIFMETASNPTDKQNWSSTFSVEGDHKVQIYVYNGYLYAKRTVDMRERWLSNWGGTVIQDVVQKQGKVALSELGKDTLTMLSYLQKMIGWSSMIHSAIESGIEDATPPAYATYEKYLNTFSVNGNQYVLSLDGKYLLANQNINNIDLTLTTGSVNGVIELTNVKAFMGIMGDPGSDMIQLSTNDMSLTSSLNNESLINSNLSAIMNGTMESAFNNAL